MNTTVLQLLAALWNSTGVALLFMVPMAVLGWLLNRRRQRFRKESEEPFTDMPLRPPGEALRQRIEALSEEFDSSLMLAALVSVSAAAGVVMSPPSQRLVVGGGLLVIVVVTVIHVGRRIHALQSDIWDYRLGFMGERAVGEHLNQLVADRFQVFHDVPFEGFNIDHVLVGPPGVYAVETKARRKPADIRGLEKARIYSDGVCLRFPKFTDHGMIPEARRNAADLSKWLTKATGEHVAVYPILTFPGWAVIREKPSDVNVLRPDEIKRSFSTPEKQFLTVGQIKRIAHQLTERCRLAKEPKLES